MPCKPKMVGCAATCGHYAIVSDYRFERLRQESVADDAGNGYRTEYEQYVATNPLITFKKWLIGSRR